MLPTTQKKPAVRRDESTDKRPLRTKWFTDYKPGLVILFMGKPKCMKKIQSLERIVLDLSDRITGTVIVTKDDGTTTTVTRKENCKTFAQIQIDPEIQTLLVSAHLLSDQLQTVMACELLEKLSDLLNTINYC